MNSKLFLEGVLSTENRDFESIRGRFNDSGIRVLHGSIGLMTEVQELLDAVLEEGQDWNKFDFVIQDSVNFIEELGDLSYYHCLVMDAYGYGYEDLHDKDLDDDFYNLNFLLKKLVHHCGELLDFSKKGLFYGKEISAEKVLESLSWVYFCLTEFAAEMDRDIEDVWRVNNEKLISGKNARYKQGYSDSDAINRDTVKERQQLEESL